MKHIILLLLLGVCSSAFAQKKIIGKWYLIELFGERNPVEMYRLQRTTQVRAGYHINFAKDKTFYSTYFAPCGLDCFVNTKGTYKRVGKHYLSFHVDTFLLMEEDVRNLNVKKEIPIWVSTMSISLQKEYFT